MSATETTLEPPRIRLRRSRPLLGADREHERKRLLDVIVVVAPALLGLALCLYQISTRSLWLDESATVAIASQHGAAFGAAVARDGGNMLAYYGLLHVVIALFGSGPLAIRLPAALGTAATVAIVGVLGLRLANRRTALLAGVLTAVSLSMVYWGQDARGYTPMIALVAASFLALLGLLEGRGGWRAWLAYVIVTTAAVYVGLEAVLVLPAQLVALIWFRDRWRLVLSAMLVTAACCIPLAVLAAERGSSQLFWVPTPSFRVLVQVVQAATSSGVQPAYYTSTTTALLVLTLVLLLAGAIRVWDVARERGVVWRPALMLSWLLVPAAVALLESAVGQSIFEPRYLLVSLPAVSLILAWTLTDRRLPRWLSLGAIAAVITLRALQLAPAYGVPSENWRGATSYVLSNAQPGDCVAFYPLDNRQAFRYYLNDFGQAPRPILPATPWRQVRPFVEDYASLSNAQIAQVSRECGRVWLVASHEGRVGGPPISKGNWTRYQLLMNGLESHYAMLPTTSFGQDGVVTVTLFSR
jgi:mannosyltransferase